MVREPILTTVDIADLRPTQITVGMREVLASASAGATPASKRAKNFSAST